MAMRRETTTYKQLSLKMFGYEASGVFANILDHIKVFCEQNDLPPLTTLVVKSDTGRPGEGLGSEDPEAERERVFSTDWYDYHPPTVRQLEQARDRAVDAR
jgi:hypothetical protein